MIFITTTISAEKISCLLILKNFNQKCCLTFKKWFGQKWCHALNINLLVWSNINFHVFSNHQICWCFKDSLNCFCISWRFPRHVRIPTAFAKINHKFFFGFFFAFLQLSVHFCCGFKSSQKSFKSEKRSRMSFWLLRFDLVFCQQNVLYSQFFSFCLCQLDFWQVNCFSPFIFSVSASSVCKTCVYINRSRDEVWKTYFKRRLWGELFKLSFFYL